MNTRLVSMIICIAFCAATTVAQTTNTFPTSGNAGIGTTTPTAPLQITRNPTAMTTAANGYSFFGWDVVDSSVTNPPLGGYNDYFGYASLPSITTTDGTSRTVGGGYFSPVFVPSGTNNGLIGVAGAANITSVFNSSTTFQNVAGGFFQAIVAPTASATTSVNTIVGVDSVPMIQSGSVGTGAYGFWATPYFGSTSGPANLVVPNYYGLYLTAPVMANGARITNNWGIYQADASAKNFFAGGITLPDGTTQTTAWTGVLCGGDYAEDMRASGSKAKYEPGDVLILADGDSSDVQKSGESYSTMVAGIYASKPGVIGRRAAVAQSTNNIPMAMVGVVPTKVTAENGPIHRGDLLVTSSTPGYAMKGTDRNRMLGAVIGKAMGPLDSGTGMIEVLVTLQ